MVEAINSELIKGMKWLVLGGNGQLGLSLTSGLKKSGIDVTSLTKNELNIVEPGNVAKAIRDINPTHIANCAAWTNVDLAETEIDNCYKVNSEAVANICAAIGERNIKLFHYSTDYVFNSIEPKYFSSTDTPNPINVYGKSKARAESEVLERLPETGYILRTSWLYGGSGKNFVNTIRMKAENGESLNVVNDQFGQPTWVEDVSRRTIDVALGQIPAGIYHLTNSGTTSWYGFAESILRECGLDQVSLSPIASHTLNLKAPRPSNSALSEDEWQNFGFSKMRHWTEALHEYITLGSNR